LEINQGYGPLHGENIMASINLSGISDAIGSLIGANSTTTASSVAQQLVTSVALGAASSAILAAIQHPDVQKALNPLGLPQLIGTTASTATPAASTTKPVVTAAAAAVLTAAQLSVLYPNGFTVSS
jgi:hypothetical protein